MLDLLGPLNYFKDFLQRKEIITFGFFLDTVACFVSFSSEGQVYRTNLPEKNPISTQRGPE